MFVLYIYVADEYILYINYESNKRHSQMAVVAR